MVFPVSNPVNKVEVLSDFPTDILVLIFNQCMENWRSLAKVSKKFNAIISRVSKRDEVNRLVSREFFILGQFYCAYPYYNNQVLTTVVNDKLVQLNFKNGESSQLKDKLSSQFGVMFNYHPKLGFYTETSRGHKHFLTVDLDFCCFVGTDYVIPYQHQPDQNRIAFKLNDQEITYIFPYPRAQLKYVNYEFAFFSDYHQEQYYLRILDLKTGDIKSINSEFIFQVFETDSFFVVKTGVRPHALNIYSKSNLEFQLEQDDHQKFIEDHQTNHEGNVIFYHTQQGRFNGRLALLDLDRKCSYVLPGVKKILNHKFSFPLIAFQDSESQTIEIWNYPARMCLFKVIALWRDFELSSFSHDHLVVFNRKNYFIHILTHENLHVKQNPYVSMELPSLWQRIYRFILQIINNISDWVTGNDRRTKNVRSLLL